MSPLEALSTLDTSAGVVSALSLVPEQATAMLVLGHGAGAGMRHPFMEHVAAALADEGIATFRYQFPYMEAGRGRTDGPPVAMATVQAATEAAAARWQLPLLVGGKSFGGRMSSHAAAADMLARARGLVFLGFPLHPPKRPSVKRAEHLAQVAIPMLFLQGTRDDLADLDLIRQVTAPLPRATLHVVEGANHGFEVLKRSGRTNQEVLAELASTTASWARTVLSSP